MIMDGLKLILEKSLPVKSGDISHESKRTSGYTLHSSVSKVATDWEFGVQFP